VPKDQTSYLPFIFMNTCNLDSGGTFQLVVDEQPILCAFALSELERLVDWGPGRSARSLSNLRTASCSNGSSAWP
jgi:hypothetical protein